jgi:branched-chain amino acid transport system permease protein
VLLFQQILNGLTIGMVYALVALGLTMVYGVLRILHFAHGAVYALGAFLALALLQLGSPFLLATVVAIVGAAVAGALIERVFYRPLAGAPPIAPLIAGVGVYLLLEDTFRNVFGPYTHALPAQAPIPALQAGPFSLTAPQVLILLTGIVLLVGLGVLIGRTALGLQMRAVAADRETAATMGIDVSWIVTLNFLLGSALAGLAGVLIALNFNAVYPTMGAIPGMKAFAVVVVGGLGSLPGAVVASLFLGVAESLIEGFFALPIGRDAAAFVLLIAVLLVRPQGLFGARLEKV